MTELNLIHEFAENHFRFGEGKLGVSSTDKLLIDRQRKFIKEQTNALVPVMRKGPEWQLHYDFNTFSFQKMIWLMKKHNLGDVKTLRRNTEDFTIKKDEIFFDRASTRIDSIYRVFVNPGKLAISFVLNPQLISHVFQAESEGRFWDKINDLKEGTSKFNEYIDPILNKHRQTKREVIQRDVARHNNYEVHLQNGESQLFRSEKNLARVEEICRKMYKANFKRVVEQQVQSLEDLIKAYNREVQEKIKALQELKII